MTDTIDRFNSGMSAVQQSAQVRGPAGYNRAMNRVFNLAAALEARGIKLGKFGTDNIEK